MNFIKTALDGVFIIEPKIFSDVRGYFFESYNQGDFEKSGLYYNFVQDNQSKSSYGTIRGIHFQMGKFAQAKLVRVLQGSVLDVAVDLRMHSPTFGKHIAIELSESNNRQLLIPRGFGHGFSVLSETAVFSYKCDNYYAPTSEGSVQFDDQLLSIDWHIDMKKALLSDKDRHAPDLKAYCQTPAFFYSDTQGI